MFQGHQYKRTFFVLAIFAVAFFLAVYGKDFLGWQAPNFKPDIKQVRNGHEEVVYFKAENNGAPIGDELNDNSNEKQRIDSTKKAKNRRGEKALKLKKQPDKSDASVEDTTQSMTTGETSASTELHVITTTVSSVARQLKGKASPNPVNESAGEGPKDNTAVNGKGTDTSDRDIQNRFSDRRNRYDRLCGMKEYKNIKSTKYITSERSDFANSRLRWCQIPKIATTFLKYVRRTHAPILKEQGITRYPRSQRKSFFLVREPYARLVSGYLCKIVTTPSFWRRYGTGIISNYRPNAFESSKTCGHDVSFPEFVKYFIKSQNSGLNKNKHFMPIHEQCSICKEKYDYIIHLETIKPDMTFIFDSVQVKMNIDIRATENEIIAKSNGMMNASRKRPACYFHCFNFQTLWWSFQARGMISLDNPLPFNEEECKSASVDKFTKLAVDAYKTFTDKEKRSKQKRQIMVDIYRQVPLADRLKVKDLLWKDFELFEYDAEPKDIFPELNQ